MTSAQYAEYNNYLRKARAESPAVSVLEYDDYVRKASEASSPTVLDIVAAASALARANGEELLVPVNSVKIAAPTLAETLANRSASSNGWNEKNRPLEVIDVLRAASANAREREADEVFA